MKNKFLSAILIGFLALAGNASGQSYDFVIGGCSAPWHSVSSVKAYTPSQSVAVYVDSRGLMTIALVGVAATMDVVTLAPGYYIHDIDIVDDIVYFCGNHSGSAMLGCADLTTFGTGSPLVHCYDITNPDAELNHMVAYKTDGGIVKVVASGRKLCNLTPCYYPYIYGTYSCQRHYLSESKFAGMVLNGFNFIETTNSDFAEMVCDIVKTDNHVGVVTNYLLSGTEILALHKCDPDDVLTTYWSDSLTYYPVADYSEGETDYIACKLSGNTIAVASVALRTGTTYDFNTHVRIFDLSTRTMTHAQQIPLTTKALLWDMVYMPEHSTLVLLQDQDLPAPDFHPTFVYLKPFSPAPYMATGFYDATLRYPFVALDAVDNDRFVSTGGNYWLLKDMTANTARNTCYKTGNIKVNKLETVAGIFQSMNFISPDIDVPSPINVCHPVRESLHPLCIINN